MKKRIEMPKEGGLTESMDIGSQGFDDFQAILLNKSKQRSNDQLRQIELLTLKYQMQDYVNAKASREKSAGEFLKDFLKTMKIKQNQFASYVGLKPSNLNKLISGERPINYDLALIFSKIFNHDPMLWIEIQAKNGLNKLMDAQNNRYSEYSLKELLEEPKEKYGNKSSKKS